MAELREAGLPPFLSDSYFGQDYRGREGNCDRDLVYAEAALIDVPFAIGARRKRALGQGMVWHYDDQVTVLFDEHGYRGLLVPLDGICRVTVPLPDAWPVFKRQAWPPSR